MTTATRPRAGKVLPGHARAHNRSLVLAELFHHGPASRADLARATGLTRVTVSDLVADLVTEELIVELGANPIARVGKPAILVGLRDDVHAVIAIDISSDRALVGAVVDLAGTIRHRIAAPLGGRTGADAFTALRDLCAELIASTDRRVLGVGVGSPGIVTEAGLIIEAPNRGWFEAPLAADLSADLGVPVHVANDANTAVLAEMTFGAAQAGWAIVVTIGHGVGSGIVLDGQLVRGAHGAAGEIGHVTVEPDGAVCGCGRRGCLETVLSAPAIRARVDGLDSAEREAGLRDVGTQLGAVLAPVVSALNLREVVLSGPAELLEGPLAEAARSAIRERTMPRVGADVAVRMAVLGEDVVLIGATALVISGQLGVS